MSAPSRRCGAGCPEPRRRTVFERLSSFFADPVAGDGASVAVAALNDYLPAQGWAPVSS